LSGPLVCAVGLALAWLPAATEAAPPQTIAGYGAGAGNVHRPLGVAVDQSSGNLYVVDGSNFRIGKFDREGNFLLAWGWGVADGSSQELQACGPEAEPPTKRCFAASSSGATGPGAVVPNAVAVDQASHGVYVADAGKRRITKFSPEGDFIFMVGRNVNKSKQEEIGGPYTQEEKNICTAADLEAGDQCGAGESGTGPGEFANPASLAIDSESHVWVGDADRIASFGPDGAPGADIALPGTGTVTSLAIDSAGDFFTLKRETLERQKISFTGLANGDTFTLGNLPAACSASSTAPIAYVSGGTGGAAETRQNIFAALEASCGASSFNLGLSGGGTLNSISISFEGVSSGVDVPLLSCAASGGGSCPVAGEVDGQLGKVQKLEAGSGAVIETVSEGGQPRAVTLDGEDNLYVGDKTFPYRLIKFNPEGEKVAQFAAGQVIGEPGGVLGGNALAVDDGSHTLYTASSRSAQAESVVQAFATPEPGPLPEAPRAEDVLPTTATLVARLNPEGHETSYRFEYDTSPYEGEAEHGARIPIPDATLPGSDYDSEDVEAELEGLLPGTTYHFRLVATDHGNPHCPGEECTVYGEDATFTTLPAVAIEAQWASEVAARSAVLHAEVDPLGVAGKWWIEYGATEALGSQTAKADLPASFGVLSLATAFNGLEPSTNYSYRFAASDVRDGVPYLVHGPIQRFTTQRGGLGFTLPDSRAWEMVSPPDKHGGEIDTRFDGDGQIQAAVGGEALAYLSRGSIEADPEGARGLDESSVLSRRGAGGAWSSEDITPPHAYVTPTSIGVGLEYKLFSPELGKGLMEPRDAAPLSPQATERTPYLRTNSSPPAYRPLVSAANALPGFGGDDKANLGAVSVAAASVDLRQVVVKSKVPLLEGAAGNALYAWSEDAAPTEALAPVSELPGGEVVAAEAGGSVSAQFGPKRQAISEDGSRAFWTPQGGGALYVRDLGRRETARLDVVQPGAFGTGKAEPVFQGAAADGSAALFTDSRELSEDASEGGRDLYRCELRVDGEGELGCELANLTGPSVAPGESANVLGLLPGMSEDTTRAYFVARGVLDEAANSEEEAAVAGEPNLYSWQEGKGVRFVATLSGDDEHDWGTPASAAHLITAAASPSGGHLAFMSSLPLTGYDNRDAVSGERAQEVFRYDAQEDELSCVSCNPSGARPRALAPGESPLARYFDPQKLWSGVPVAALLPEATKLSLSGYSLYRSRSVHDNGRVFFNAADSLVPADSNGDGDVYQYEPTGLGSCTPSSGGPGVARIEGGCVALISSGGAGGTAAFLDASVGGDDVFFFTQAKLSVTDKDEATDVYDARVGGVEARLSLSVECQGEACQPPAATPEAPNPASASFVGPGNLGEAASCRAQARRAQSHSRGAQRLRRAVRNAASPRRAKRLRRASKRSANRARAFSKKAKRCRSANRRAQR
jgi:DNA-binding beta-propeller fold protein YncE